MAGSSNTSAVQARLRAVVDEGIARDLFRAMRAETVLRETGAAADAINKAGFGDFFGTIQEHAFSAMVLALARMFDRTSAKNQTRSVEEVKRILENQAQDIVIVDRPYLEQCLERNGSPVADGASDVDLLRTAADVIGKICAQADPLLAGIRRRRDKFLAHHDVKSGPVSLAAVVVGDVEKLFGLAVEVLDLTARPLLSIVHVNEGRFFLGSDARRIRGRLGQVLGLVIKPDGDKGA